MVEAIGQFYHVQILCKGRNNVTEDAESHFGVEAIRLVPLLWCLQTWFEDNSIFIALSGFQDLTFFRETELDSELLN